MVRHIFLEQKPSPLCQDATSPVMKSMAMKATRTISSGRSGRSMPRGMESSPLSHLVAEVVPVVVSSGIMVVCDI